MELAVHISESAKGNIKNERYDASSDEVTVAIGGVPTNTIIHEPAVKLSPGQTGMIFDPCNSATNLNYTHQITNTGNYTDTFSLSLTSSQGWAQLDVHQTTLGAGGNGIFKDNSTFRRETYQTTRYNKRNINFK